ncbi:MAG: hypothetical protein KKI07_00355 [Euryarchaeota archaeon]|nr:hypothetical protein [Euryarchaeota archaeon]
MLKYIIIVVIVVVKMALKHMFGETPVIKILDFLIDHKGYDYSKTEIAENSNIGWATLNRCWNQITEWGFVKETRKIGRATLYKLNEANTIVKKLLEFDAEAIIYMSEKIAREEVTREEAQKVEESVKEIA